MPSKSHRSGKWVASVKTESTYPQKGLFSKSASAIARSLASKNVSAGERKKGAKAVTMKAQSAGKLRKRS